MHHTPFSYHLNVVINLPMGHRRSSAVTISSPEKRFSLNFSRSSEIGYRPEIPEITISGLDILYSGCSLTMFTLLKSVECLKTTDLTTIPILSLLFDVEVRGSYLSTTSKETEGY